MAAPQQPEAPEVEKATHHSITLTWEAASTGESGAKCNYKVEMKKDSSDTDDYKQVYMGYSTNCVLDNLDPRTEYLVRLRAIDPRGKMSRWSEVINAETRKMPSTSEGLHKAVKNNDLPLVKEIIEHGVSTELPDIHGFLPLMVASKLKYMDVVATLIAGGAVVNATNTAGKTALMVAAASGHLDVVQVLVENGASLHHQDVSGNYPIHSACDTGRNKVIMFLVSSSPSLLDVPDGSGWSPLLRCASIGGSVFAATALVNLGADINFSDSATGITPLIAATINGFDFLVEYLLSAGARAGAQNKQGLTALDCAQTFGTGKCLELLRGAG